MRVVETAAVACCLDYSSDALVVGCMDGVIVQIDEQGLVSSRVKVFKRPVRNVKCLPDHRVLCSSSDGFLALATLTDIVFRVKVAGHAISAIEVLPDIHAIAVGTDNGDLLVVDFDDPKATKFTAEAHDDSITSIVYNGPKKTLITCGSDGLVAVFDVRRGTEFARSEPLEDELLSMLLMANGTRVCCGSALGVISVFSWGFFGVPDRRIKGRKSGGINTMCLVDQNRFLVGSSAGTIQLVDGTQRMASMTVDHSVESMACRNGCVAHIDQDGVIRLWNVCELVGESAATAPEDLDRTTFLDGFK